jgi:tRNA pseudouridine(55) synthase
MATGVLVIGIEKATRLLGHLTLTEKTYQTTIRLGQSTSTDDAEGEPTGGSPAGEVTREALEEQIAKLTGEILQVPSSVSAIKVNGQRAYKLTRAGEAPELAARPVTVYEFLVTAVRQEGDFLDIDAIVRCSSGTYIRALARDLGTALCVGGHLTALRRTAVGPYTLAQAHTLQELENQNQNQSSERVRLSPTPHAPLQPSEASVVSQAQPARPAPDPRLGSQASPGTSGTSQSSAGTSGPGSAPAASREPAILPAPSSAALHPADSPAPSGAPTEASGANDPPVTPPAPPSAPPPVTPLAEAAAAAFPRLDLTADEARRLAQGARLPLPTNTQLPDSPPWPTAPNLRPNVPLAAFAPNGTLVALVTADRGQISSLAVFADPNLAFP